jgi:hypothetical protein
MRHAQARWGSLGGPKFVDAIRCRHRFFGAAPLNFGNGRALEKERHRDVQNMGEMQQTTGADSVGACLVFLHLLESKAERLAKRPLYSCRARARPHVARDVFVSRAGALLVHFITPDKRSPYDVSNAALTQRVVKGLSNLAS